jgi:hypothetical protein
MTRQQIDTTYQQIRSQIKRARFQEALEGLDVFVNQLGDVYLETDVLSLTARFHEQWREKIRLGSIDREEHNLLILSTLEVLNQAKTLAYEQASDLEPAHNPVTDEAEKLAQRIAALEAELDAALRQRLDDIIVPDNYQVETSKEFAFAFCYPKDWNISRFPQQVQYGAVSEPFLPGQNKFGSNMNIVLSDISQNPLELEQLYEQALREVTAVVYQPELKFREAIKLRGLPAFRYRIDYTTNDDRRLSLMQVLVANATREKLYILSFTTTSADFEQARIVFDNMLSTFRV